MAIKQEKKQNAIIILFYMLIPLTALICLSTGRYHVPLFDLIKILAGAESSDSLASVVIIKLRLPRIMLAFLCGAGLAASGVAFQALFGNPLASPDTLGTGSGACFGAVFAMFLGFNLVGVQLFAVFFGFVSCLLSWKLSMFRGRSNITMLVLSGLMISALFSALISLVKYVADPEDQLPSITYWLLGSFSAANYNNLLFILPFLLLGFAILFPLSWKLNLLSLSEDEQRSLGLNVKFTRFLVIQSCCFLTGACVSVCGQAGWVGLLVPHLCRLMIGNNTKKILPLSVSFGGIFLMFIDTFARSMSAAEIPLSVLTAIFGAPVFILLLRKNGGEILQ